MCAMCMTFAVWGAVLVLGTVTTIGLAMVRDSLRRSEGELARRGLVLVEVRS